jgi:hypothetical protein
MACVHRVVMVANGSLLCRERVLISLPGSGPDAPIEKNLRGIYAPTPCHGFCVYAGAQNTARLAPGTGPLPGSMRIYSSGST